MIRGLPDRPLSASETPKLSHERDDLLVIPATPDSLVGGDGTVGKIRNILVLTANVVASLAYTDTDGWTVVAKTADPSAFEVVLDRSSNSEATASQTKTETKSSRPSQKRTRRSQIGRSSDRPTCVERITRDRCCHPQGVIEQLPTLLLPLACHRSSHTRFTAVPPGVKMLG